MTLHENVRDRVAAIAARDDAGQPAALNDMLRLLSKWRSVLIQNTILQHEGTVVRRGPLAGLDFLEQSAEGCHAAKLLGCYEQPLHPHVADAIARGYERILNIGCAEGYYAVGMARHMPATRAFAYDLDPNARATCAALAAKNGVSNRITIGELFTPADFAEHADARTLVFCDIEGNEEALLDPDAAPALRHMDIIVEAHDCLKPGISDRLIARFSATHDISVVTDTGLRQLDDAPAWFTGLAHLDQLLATWEWRSGPTPWLVMHATGR